MTQVVTNTQVTITASGGAKVVYTSDGSDPTNSPTAHTVNSPFAYTISDVVTLRALSRQAGVGDSPVVWRLYTTGGVSLQPYQANLTANQFTTFVMSGSSGDSWGSVNDFFYFLNGP